MVDYSAYKIQELKGRMKNKDKTKAKKKSRLKKGQGVRLAQLQYGL